MNEENFASLISNLSELSKSQLADVRRRCVFLLQGHTGKESFQEEDWILSGILIELRSRGLEKQIPNNFRIKGNSSFAGYETKSERIRLLLEEAVPDMTLVERKTLGIISARSLAEFISDWTEVSLHSMLQFVDRIPQAIECAFPSYISSGMLGALFRKGLSSGVF